LRWERLKNRYESHRSSVDNVAKLLTSCNVDYRMIARDEMHRGNLLGRDLVIAVGGDGTVLNSASFLNDDIPILGVNSDPTRPEEKGVTKVTDERRSKGALCAATADNIHEILPRILSGEISPYPRTRLRCIIRSTYTETRLPPALNDVLVAHPIPASVSRFRMSLYHTSEKTEVQSIYFVQFYLFS
jgi:NAD+ kinase